MPPRTVFLGLDGTPQLTENEQRFVKALFKSLTAVPEADWDKCAQELGLKDSKCAKERWRQISTKRGWTGHVRRATHASASACEASTTATAAVENSPTSREQAHPSTQSIAKRPKPEKSEETYSKSAIPRDGASREVKKEAKVKHETVAKKKTAVDKTLGVGDDVKFPNRGDNARGSRFFKRKGAFKKGESTVTPKAEPNDTIKSISAIPTGSRKRKRGTKRAVINLDSDDEDFTASGHDGSYHSAEHKKPQRDTEECDSPNNVENISTHPGMEHNETRHASDDDNQHSDHGAHIPFGHPNHCMSF